MQHEHHRVPVTALAICEGFLLASQGPTLCIYQHDNDRKSLSCVQVFENQAIHGILGYDDVSKKVLIWGGQLVRIGKLHSSDDETLNIRTELGPVLEADDWILDAAVANAAEADSQRVVGLVTAHNALLTIDSKPNLPLAVRSLVLGSNCILYSTHITWLSASQCLIASGTAFGDVLVWTCTLHEDRAAMSQLHFSFRAHEGSVFGVQISQGLNIGGRSSRLLASCSDDRTIRVWDITSLPATVAEDVASSRTTGFGGSADDAENAPVCLVKTLGHISRIWSVRFASHEEGIVSAKLLSFGEDSTTIIWRLCLKANEKNNRSALHELEQLESRASHAGKNIWSVELKEDGLLATGGADGAIVLYNTRQTTAGQLFDFDKLAGNLGNSGDFWRVYTLLDLDQLVLTTNLGWVYTGNLRKQDSSLPLTHLHDLRGHSVVASRCGVAFVSGADEFVHIFTAHQQRLRIARGVGKTAGLFTNAVTYKLGNSFGHELSLLVTLVGHNTAQLYYWDLPDGGQIRGLLGDPKEALSIDLPSGMVITSYCGAIFPWKQSRQIFLGARNGSVAVLSSSIRAVDTPAILQKIMTKVHDEEAVTQLAWRASEQDVGRGYLFSSGRDGCYTAFAANLHASPIAVELVNRTSLPFGPNIEDFDIAEDGGRLLVWGFRSKCFVQYDATAEQEIMMVDCGGAHRSWAFLPSPCGGTLVWTQATRLHVYTQVDIPAQMINGGGHGREIKAQALSRTAPHLLATGSEDTDIKIFTYEERKFRCLRTLRKHTTGIQHLQWSDCGRYLYSSGGFEEFFIWRVQDVPVIAIGVVCETQMPTSTGEMSDLRIMSFSPSTLEQGGTVMHKVRAVYSDSTVRFWSYEKGQWQLTSVGSYQTACLTQVLSLDPKVEEQGHNENARLLTAATDGHVALWQVQSLSDIGGGRREPCKLSCITCWKVHQSAILSLTSFKLSDSSMLLITGGDDNAIGFTRLTDATNEPKTLLVPRAHAAAVTGLAIILGVTPNGFQLASAALDQRVKIWHISVDVAKPGVEGLDVRRAHNVFTPVADVSGMDLLMDNGEGVGVVICGVGMDVWRIQP